MGEPEMNDAARVTMMEELPESEAMGQLAEIYEEVRRYCGVPYVSSMQRYLATMPGCLEWVWAAIRPAMINGVVQEAAWLCMNSLSLAPLAPVSRPALRLFGVGAEAEIAIRAACDTFVRVSPINMIFGGCVRYILEKGDLNGAVGSSGDWTPPKSTANLPAFVDPSTVSGSQAAVLSEFRRGLGEGSFIPGPYRMFARWPAYLAHVATELGPVLAGPGYAGERDVLFDAIDASVPKVAASLPPIPENIPEPSPQEATLIQAAVASYRQTSAEMIIVGTLLRNALPVES
jgi:hypothetical protein